MSRSLARLLPDTVGSLAFNQHSLAVSSIIARSFATSQRSRRRQPRAELLSNKDASGQIQVAWPEGTTSSLYASRKYKTCTSSYKLAS